MTKDWKTWCRLCARENGSEIDVFIKNENVTSIADAIQSYFSISILNTDAIPTKICNVCYDIVIELINFTIRCGRVQELFNEIQFDQNLEIDLNELRIKYGITHKIYELKCLKDNQNIEKQEIIKINEVPEGSFLDENIDGFFKCDNNSTFGIDSEEEYDNGSTESSEDEKPLLKLKIKKEILPQRQRVKQRRRVNVIPEELVESKLSENEFEEKVEASFLGKIENDENGIDISNETECSSLTKNTLKRSKRRIRQRKESVVFCGICRKNFNSKAKYNYHMKVKHKIATKSEPVICKTCGKRFKKQSKLEEHENMHLPPEERKWYGCPQCDKKFAMQRSIQLHISAAHIREKKFICEECGKAFVTIDQLNSHKVVHSDFTPFHCPKCPKSFKRLPSLKNHIDSHEDTKYICPICGCQLNTKTILRRHMVIHSDEKKYKCNFCQKEFKRTKALKNHLILHTGLKPYECPFCDQTFANGSNCRKHQKNSHPTELAVMEQSGEKIACKNVPRLEHLKAVNNAAINNSNDGVNSKIESALNQDINKFCINNTDEKSIKTITASIFGADSQNINPLNSNLCENLNFPINPKIEVKEANVLQSEISIASEEISSEYQN